MQATQKTWIVLRLLTPLILLVLGVACGVRLLSYRGSWVEEQDRIALQDGGPHKGKWQSRELVISYAYQQEAKSIQISGVVELADFLTAGFGTLEYLSLHLNFLKSDGIVLDSNDIRIYGYRRYIDFLGKMTFNHRFDLSEDTVAMAFSYSGKVSQGGGGVAADTEGDRIDWDFWKIPRSKPPG